MQGLHTLTEPIPAAQLKDLQMAPEKPLERLQGNILQGHGRDHAVHILFKFTADKTSVMQWISGLAGSLTSAQQQLINAKEYRDFHIPGPLFVNFFLSADGYRHLGLDPAKKPGFDRQAFIHGMKAASHRLNDPPQDTWDQAYTQAIDAMLLLADDDEYHLLRQASQYIEASKAYAATSAVEHGWIMRNAQGKSIEHFGYADGLGQPLFFQDTINRRQQRGPRPPLWDAGTGPDVVLVRDPHGSCDSDCGSYLVFRKLEQNVRGYKERELELANALGLRGQETKRAGALVMGRFEDGTPIAVQPTPGRPTNDFTYDEDPDGEKCPIQSHIRKVNARQPGIPRIARRGMTYGKRWKEPKDNPSLDELPSEGVGLLFISYQRSIARQFELLQYLWANDSRMPYAQQPGVDPVAGQLNRMAGAQQKWPAQWNDRREKHRPFDFHGFVTMKGGEYFFAPSIDSLRLIKSWKID